MGCQQVANASLLHTDSKHQQRRSAVNSIKSQLVPLLSPGPPLPPLLLLITIPPIPPTPPPLRGWTGTQDLLLTILCKSSTTQLPSSCPPQPLPPPPAADHFEALRQFASQECSRIGTCHPPLNRCCFPLQTVRAMCFFLQTTQCGVFCYSNW